MTEKPKKKNNGSAILRCINKLAFWIERKIKTGFVGNVLGSYTKEDQAMKKSFTASIVGRKSIIGALFEKIRFVIAEQFEESRLLSILRKFINFFLGCRLRFYGTFFMTFGAYIVLIYFFKKFFVANEEPRISYLITAIILIASSVPLLLSGQAFAHRVVSSKAGHFIAVDILGISEEKMNVPKSRYSDIYNIAIFAGIACGTLSYFIDPLYIIGTIFSIFAVAVIISRPEIGVLGAVAFLPYLSGNGNTDFLSIIIILYSVGYFIKLICGKRVLNFEIIDLVILFFAIILTLSGASYIGDVGASRTTLVIFVVGAFVAGNLMRTKIWQLRCVVATILSGTVVSMIIILKETVNLAGYTEMAESINKTVFFDNGKILAGYLIVSLLFVLAEFFNRGGVKKSIVLLMATSMLIIAIILLGSVSAWIGASVAIILFFFIKTKKTLSALLISGVVLPCALTYTYEFLPERLRNIFDFTSTRIYSTLKIWQGSMQLVVASKFGGIGVSGFDYFYPIYSVNGFESAKTSGALWMRILTDVGLIGLIIFIFIAFLCIQNCFEYLSRSNGKGNSFIIASFAAFIGLFVQSLACDFFSNKAFFYAFWVFIAVICAAIRSERQEAEKNNGLYSNSEHTASVLL